MKEFKSVLKFIAIIIFALMAWSIYQDFKDGGLSGGVVVQPTAQVIVIYPTQPVTQAPIAVEPTWTPFIQIISIPSTPEPTLNPDHVRTGITPGTTGNHNPGRTDNRTP